LARKGGERQNFARRKTDYSQPAFKGWKFVQTAFLEKVHHRKTGDELGGRI